MILDAIEQVGGIYVVTADHGNAEDMVKRNKSGQPLLDKNGNIQILTSHTLQPVSFSSSSLLKITVNKKARKLQLNHSDFLAQF